MKIPDIASNLKLSVDKSGKVITVKNISDGKILMISVGGENYSLIPGGSIEFGPEGVDKRRYYDEDDYDDREYGNCHD